MQAIDWLPPEIVESVGVRERLEEALTTWSRAWFPRTIFSAQRHRLAFMEARPDTDGGGWRIWREAVGLSCTDRDQMRLVELALDGCLDGLRLSHTDREVINEFRKMLLGDLLHRIEYAFDLEGPERGEPLSLADPYGRHGGLEIVVADEAGRTFALIAIPQSAVVARFKASLGKSERPTPQLTCLEQALGSTPVSLQAILGHAFLPAAEIKTIAPGDVLVLDTHVDGAAAISTTSRTPGLRGKLLEDDGRVALSLFA